MENLPSWVQPTLAICGLLFGLWLIAGPFIMKKLKPAITSRVKNSDRKAPDGFAEHVQLIIDASPGADPEVREAYFKEALTEAQTLRRENERLNGIKEVTNES